MRTLLMVIAATMLVGHAAAGPLNRLPKVVDSTGRQLGGLYNESTVLRREEGVVVKLGLVGGIITGTAGIDHTPLHETTDCSGIEYAAPYGALPSPWILADTYFVRDPTTGLPTQTVAYLYEQAQPRVIASIQAVQPDPDCANYGGTRLPNGYCCVPLDGGPTSIAVSPVRRFDASIFVPPYTAR